MFLKVQCVARRCVWSCGEGSSYHTALSVHVLYQLSSPWIHDKKHSLLPIKKNKQMFKSYWTNGPKHKKGIFGRISCRCGLTYWLKFQELWSRQVRCAVGWIPVGESVVVVDLSWLTNRCRRPVFLQSSYTTCADYFLPWDGYGSHLLEGKAFLPFHTLMRPGLVWTVLCKIHSFSQPDQKQNQQHDCSLYHWTAPNMSISLWLLPTVCGVLRVHGV